MVAHSGTTVRADRLRPLNAPRPIRVEVDDRGFPRKVHLGRNDLTPTLSQGERGSATEPQKDQRTAPRPSEGVAVVEIVDRWRIDDEWWRQEVSRMYFRIVLAGGAILNIFHDLLQGGWYLQTTASPLEKAEPVEVLAPTAQAKLSTKARRSA